MNGVFFYSEILENTFTIRLLPSSDITDLIGKLLEKDPKKRLGGLKGDALKIKSHPFFSVSSFPVTLTIN
jgi:hypothetical protein